MSGYSGRRDQVLGELDDAFAGLQATYKDLPEARKRVVMQGNWSVKDILVHIAGWHREMAGALSRIARGERAAPEGVDYSDFDAWNARFVEAARATPVSHPRITPRRSGPGGSGRESERTGLCLRNPPASGYPDSSDEHPARTARRPPGLMAGASTGSAVIRREDLRALRY